MSDNRSPRATAPVKLHYSFKKIMTGSDLSHRRLPMMSAVSASPGPLVWITACGHGDEVSGIVVIQEIFRNIRRLLRCGAIHAFPLMNPFGFEMVSRNISISSEDLNRSFPGNPDGTPGERIASRILDTMLETRPALVLDLHNDWIESIPYVLLDHNPGQRHRDVYRRAVNAGRQSGMCLVVDDEKLTSSLSYNLLLNDIPALTLELGKSYVVSESDVRYGVSAIFNILQSLDMISGHENTVPCPLPEGYGCGKLLHYSDKPWSSRTGIIRFMVKPGEAVRTDQPLARIYNAFGRRQETIRALQDAVVLGCSDSSAAFPGIPVMSFGVPVKHARDIDKSTTTVRRRIMHTGN